MSISAFSHVRPGVSTKASPLTTARRLSRAVFGFAMSAFALENLVRLDGVPQLEPFPSWLGARAVLAVLSGAVLLGGGTLINAPRLASRAASALAVLTLLWLLSLQAPLLIQQPKNGGLWVVLFEVCAIAAACTFLAASLLWQDAEFVGVSGDAWRRVAVWARIAFGLSFIAFGISHFVYTAYVEAVIPAWIPAHKFFAYFTGLAHLAAGISLVSGIRYRLAAAMLVIMFGCWVLILHVPRVAAARGNANEWTSLIIAIAMCGGAWLFAAEEHSGVRFP
ncbi:MAG: DoxX family membrane protein [Gemmatimonadaceae bacterium]